MKGHLKRLVVLSLIFLSFFLTIPLFASSVNASKKNSLGDYLPEEEYNKYAENSFSFYDPNGCIGETASSGAKTCTAPTGDKITWIGDSYSEGAKELIEKKLPGVDLGDNLNECANLSGTYPQPNHYVRYSKQIQNDLDCTTGQASGLTLLKEIIDNNKLRPYLVFALGTNNPPGNATEVVKKIIDMVNGKANIVFVTAHTKNGDYNNINSAYREAAKNNQNVAVADWDEAAKGKDDTYYISDSDHPEDNGGYEAWTDTIISALPQSCSTGLLAGNTSEEKVWNYFVKANIPKVSDNPMVISGIIGNLVAESGINPFSNGKGYYGFEQDNTGEIKKAIDDAGLGQYWANDGKDAPQDAVDKAMGIELDVMVNSSSFKDFIDRLDKTSEKSPESYAELFATIYERCCEVSEVPGDPLLDSGVIQTTSDLYGGKVVSPCLSITRYQGVNTRRSSAREVYDKFSAQVTTSTVSSSSSTASASSTTTVSGSFTKYHFTDNQLRDLTEVAVSENGGNVLSVKQELSLMANLFEKNGKKEGNVEQNFIDYITSGGWFGNGKGQYFDNQATIVNGGQVPADRDWELTAKPILNNGQRVLPATIDEHDCIDCNKYPKYNYTNGTRGDVWFLVNDGKVEYDVKNSSNYIKNKTIVVTPYNYQEGIPETDQHGWTFYDWMGGDPEIGDPMGSTAGPADDSGITSDTNGQDACPNNTSSSSNCSPTYENSDFPNYKQRDTQWDWSGTSYSGGSACGPTSYAEIVATLTGDKSITPPIIAALTSTSPYYDVSSVSGMYENDKLVADKYGLEVVHITYSSIEEGKKKMEEYLRQGYMLHTDGGQGPNKFTTGRVSSSGHYISLLKMTGDQVLVSNMTGYKGLGNQEYTLDELFDMGLNTYDGGASYHLAFSATRNPNKSGNCPGIGENGLTEEQAKKLVMWYGENKNDDTRNFAGGYGNSFGPDNTWQWDHNSNGCYLGNNCVTFSRFFGNKFSDTPVYSGLGGQLASNMNINYPSNEYSTDKPLVFSIFSMDLTGAYSGYGHTGVIVGYDGENYITAEAACGHGGNGRGDGTRGGGGFGYIQKFSPSDLQGRRFFKLNIDTNKLMNYIENGP